DQEANSPPLKCYQVATAAIPRLRQGWRGLSCGWSYGHFVHFYIVAAGSCAPSVDIDFEPEHLPADLRRQLPNPHLRSYQIGNSLSEPTQRDLKLSPRQ